MKSKLFLTVLLLAAITTVGCPRDNQPQSANEQAAKARAQEARIAKQLESVQSLVGIEGITIFIRPLWPGTESMGLTTKQLATAVIRKLRLAGIKLISARECEASVDKVIIDVEIRHWEVANTLTNELGFCYCLDVKLTQSVNLVRPSYRKVTGATWDSGRSMAICDKAEFSESVLQDVKRKMDRFINDYFIANPKK